MRDKKKLEVIIKIIQKVYNKNLAMQEVIDALMIE